VKGIPRNTRNLGARNHLDAGIMNVDGITDNRTVIEYFDTFGNTGNCKEFVVLVELDTGYNG